jgi:ferritin-like protein
MITALAQGLFLSGLAWLAGIAKKELAQLWEAAKQDVAAIENKPIAKAEKAAKITAALAPMIPDQYEDRAGQLIKILIEAAIIYVRRTTPKK